MVCIIEMSGVIGGVSYYRGVLYYRGVRIIEVSRIIEVFVL